jgi:hypothetical protein
MAVHHNRYFQFLEVMKFASNLVQCRVRSIARHLYSEPPNDRIVEDCMMCDVCTSESQYDLVDVARHAEILVKCRKWFFAQATQEGKRWVTSKQLIDGVLDWKGNFPSAITPISGYDIFAAQSCWTKRTFLSSLFRRMIECEYFKILLTKVCRCSRHR